MGLLALSGENTGVSTERSPCFCYMISQRSAIFQCSLPCLPTLPRSPTTSLTPTLRRVVENFILHSVDLTTRRIEVPVFLPHNYISSLRITEVLKTIPLLITQVKLASIYTYSLILYPIILFLIARRYMNRPVSLRIDHNPYSRAHHQVNSVNAFSK